MEAQEAALLRRVGGGLGHGQQPGPEGRGVVGVRLRGDDPVDLAQLVEDLLARERALGPEAREWVVVVLGVLADVAADEDARLIVVGAGERGKTARRLIGSVADSVAERASCDVLIVRPRDEADPVGEPWAGPPAGRP